MGNDPFDGPTLLGVIEVDETLMGDKRKNVGRGLRQNKTWVAAALQRNGKVRLERIPDVTPNTLHLFVNRNIKGEAEAIYMAESRGYLGSADEDTRHETENHFEEEWVVGDVHADGVEGVWSLFPSSIVGAFHQISKKHLDRYIEENDGYSGDAGCLFAVRVYSGDRLGPYQPNPLTDDPPGFER